MFSRSKKNNEKSFAVLIEEANAVFHKTISKLQSISSDITEEIKANDENIHELTIKNVELSELRAKSDRQIEQISKLIE